MFREFPAWNRSRAYGRADLPLLDSFFSAINPHLPGERRDHFHQPSNMNNPMRGPVS